MSAGALSQEQRSAPTGAAEYRYGIVFLLIFSVVVFEIVSPDGDGSRALEFALVGAGLLIAIATSRGRSTVRRRQAAIAGAAVALLTLAIGIGVVPANATFALTALLTLAIPVTLGRGLLRLVRAHGATPQAVAGGLAIYLLLGLGFASAIGFVAAVGPHPYFAQGTAGSVSSDVYYSFTALTTTGFGDLTAAHRIGRALAVMEMLTGQLYLVTVIGILIGRRVGRTTVAE